MLHLRSFSLFFYLQYAGDFAFLKQTIKIKTSLFLQAGKNFSFFDKVSLDLVSEKNFGTPETSYMKIHL